MSKIDRVEQFAIDNPVYARVAAKIIVVAVLLFGGYLTAKAVGVPTSLPPESNPLLVVVAAGVVILGIFVAAAVADSLADWFLDGLVEQAEKKMRGEANESEELRMLRSENARLIRENCALEKVREENRELQEKLSSLSPKTWEEWKKNLEMGRNFYAELVKELSELQQSIKLPTSVGARCLNDAHDLS